MQLDPFKFQMDKLPIETLKYQQTVEKIARKHTIGTSISWEDAAQTAYTKIWKATRAGKFGKGGVNEFYHWAAKVAKNAIIDHVRQQTKLQCQSLDQTIPGTDLSWLDTVADDFDLLDAIEFHDLLVRTREAIKQLDRRYPNRGYLKLWHGKVQGKTETQLAAELGISQGEISKRLNKELPKRIAEELGLFQVDEVKREQCRTYDQKDKRRRSNIHW